QIRVDLHARPESRQLTRFASALERARKHEGEIGCGEQWLEEARLLPSSLRQWNVRASRVLPRERPFRLAVAHEHPLSTRFSAGHWLTRSLSRSARRAARSIVAGRDSSRRQALVLALGP